MTKGELTYSKSDAEETIVLRTTSERDPYDIQNPLCAIFIRSLFPQPMQYPSPA